MMLPLLLALSMGVPIATAAEWPVQDPSPIGIDQDCPVPAPEGIIAAIGNEQIPEDQLRLWIGADLEANVQDRIRARIDLLQVSVQDRLFKIEAKRLGFTREQYIEHSIHEAIVAPTLEELQREMRSSPDLYGDDLDQVREEVQAAVLRKKTTHRGREVLQEIAGRIPVELLAAPLRSQFLDLGLQDVLAMVGGEELRAHEIEESLEDLEHEYDWKKYEIEITELNRRINDRLLAKECEKRQLTPRDLLQQEVISRIDPVTDGDVETFYQMNRSRIIGNLDEIRDSIRAHLAGERRVVLEARFAERMRAAADVTIYLKEPNPPVHIIETDDRMSMGPEGAPLQLVEFVDFQCERCKELWEFVKTVQQLHPEKIQVVIKNQPLGSIHPMSMSAALAAEAARLQGKYWEMAAALFNSHDSLSPATIEAMATRIGLDLDRFNRDRLSPQLVMMITEDLSEGSRLGIDRTPMLYLNGRKLKDKSWEGILQGVQREFFRQGL
ncbi:MAG: thioredoxin domain-containing protein [Planctomycetota bacterium]|nr:thioredoxin domain-containing protein [Planctomycetota bacterium]